MPKKYKPRTEVILKDMNDMPLQTLQDYKPKVEKPKPEVMIQQLSIELERVRKNFGTSVQSRRDAYLHPDIVEEEMSIKDKEIEEERMKIFLVQTRALVDLEIKRYKKAYDNILKEYHEKDEYSKEDQDALRRSDEIIEKKKARVNRFENIKNILHNEIKVGFSEKLENELFFKNIN